MDKLIAVTTVSLSDTKAGKNIKHLIDDDMTSNSHFQQLAHLITVTDICTPFLSTFESRSLVRVVWTEWSDLCDERGLDPVEQIAIVTDENKVIGWIGYV